MKPQAKYYDLDKAADPIQRAEWARLNLRTALRVLKAAIQALQTALADDSSTDQAAVAELAAVPLPDKSPMEWELALLAPPVELAPQPEEAVEYDAIEAELNAGVEEWLAAEDAAAESAQEAWIEQREAAVDEALDAHDTESEASL